MATAEFLDLRPLYFAHRRFIAKEAAQARFAETSRWLRDLGRRTTLSLAARNQVLFDAVHILADDWSEQKANAWNFVDLADLDAPLAKLNALRHEQQDVDLKPHGELIATLDRLVAEARAETPATYAAFVETETARRHQEGKHFSEIEEYSDWYSRFRSYLVLDLSFPDEMSDGEVEQAIEERIDFFLACLPENSGLEGHFRPIARQYIDLKLAQDMKKAAQRRAAA